MNAPFLELPEGIDDVTTVIDLDTEIPPSNIYLRRALVEVHKGKCFYTRDTIDIDTFHVEHIHPKSKGGKDCIANYVPANMSINMMKMANYDDHATELIVAKNRLTFGPRVLRRYLYLRQLAQVKSTHGNIGLYHKKDIHTAKIPEGMRYIGGEYIDMLIEKSENTVDKNITNMSSIEDYGFDRYSVSLQFADQRNVNDLKQAYALIGSQSEVIFSKYGILIPKYLNPSLCGGANLVGSMECIPNKCQVRVHINIPFGVDRYPDSSDAVKYFREIIRKVEAIMG